MPFQNRGLSIIFLLVVQFRFPLVPSRVDLTASRMLQSLISPTFGVTPFGCQPSVLLHTSSITWTLTFIVAVLLLWVAVSV